MAAAILELELGITRIFSVIAWYHFAFLAVSLALFGLSASAVFVYLAAPWHPPERLHRQLRRYALAFAALIALVGAVLLWTDVGSTISSGSMGSLVGFWVLLAAPFFAGGACLALAVSRFHGDIHRVYAADLVGAAAGCIVFIPALNILGGPGPLLVAIVLAAMGAWSFSRHAGAHARLLPACLALAALALCGIQSTTPVLDVAHPRGGPRSHLFSKWNSHSRVAVYDEHADDWGLSRTWRGSHPATLKIDIDAGAATPILLAQTVSEVAYLRAEVTALGYHLLEPGAKVLVIGPGGGRDLWTARLFGATEITGVEINSIIVDDVMGDRFRPLSGDVYHQPGVEVIVDDGRSFVAHSDRRWHLIQLSLVDTWAANAAGAFALTENNIYTVEAFTDFLGHLERDGVLTISRWSSDNVRLTGLVRAAGERLGWASVGDHLFVAERSPDDEDGVGVSTIVVKGAPLAPEDVQQLSNIAAELEFQVLWAPRRSGVDAAPSSRRVAALLNAPSAEDFYRARKRRRTPVTDDRPFFFFDRSPDHLWEVLSGRSSKPGTNGLALMTQLLFVSVALVTLFIVLPLVLGTARRSEHRELPLGKLGLFAAVGAGFMLVEIQMIQRFGMFLGHPAYGLTVVLFTLLLGGGLGAALSRGLHVSRGRLLLLSLAAVVLLTILLAHSLPVLLGSLRGLAVSARLAVACLLLLPYGMVLGTPLPTGIAILGERRPNLVAWAWGLNGATSVLGSVVALLIALLYGFRAVALTGAAVYGVAFVLAHWLIRTPQSARSAERS